MGDRLGVHVPHTLLQLGEPQCPPSEAPDDEQVPLATKDLHDAHCISVIYILDVSHVDLPLLTLRLQ